MSSKKLTQYTHLKKLWTKRLRQVQKNVYAKHGDSLVWINNSAQKLLVGSTGLFLLTQPVATSTLAQATQAQNTPAQALEKPQHTSQTLVSQLANQLPAIVNPLTQKQEDTIIQTLSNYFNLRLFAQLENKSLNRTYGLIGAEQHLMRYPGDVITTHFYTQADTRFAPSGVAPGRGAWGYFANSKEELTEADIEREKWYIAVPTFLSPGWKEDPNSLYAFFKYRKMLVVNPQNGKAVIADIADAGPAEWTGKHLGGSPEVMDYLERQDGSERGPVLYFFIDDPGDTIRLGPIQVQ
ncbi:MAG: hypothetical protein NUV65_01795 [Candidatus Roizmanbacteria bacterium]|nr:hypothetical protein [Candidatus Roizmanbacteria bacterium]